MAFASWKDRKAIAGALRSVYRAENAEAGLTALDAFEAGTWGQNGRGMEATAAPVVIGQNPVRHPILRWVFGLMNATDLAQKIRDKLICLSAPRTSNAFMLEVKASYHCHTFVIPSV
jgi:hypothetical protein